MHAATTQAITTVRQGAPDGASNPEMLVARLVAELVQQGEAIRQLIGAFSGFRLVRVTMLALSRTVTLTGADIPSATEVVAVACPSQDVGVIYMGRDLVSPNVLNFSSETPLTVVVNVLIVKL